MNVFAAFFGHSGNGNILEVSRVSVNLRLIRITYGRLRQLPPALSSTAA
jgi:hypothetical protein